jgi:hypothetical protein
MNHKNRQDSFRRTAGKVKTQRRFILYVEGRNTESSYFNLLKRSNCKVVPVTKGRDGIAKCVDYVLESLKAWNTLPDEERSKYDQRWLVFDADDRADFAEGVKLARAKGFQVAFSNMCIEYWFMLHFYESDGSPIPRIGTSLSAAHIKRINDFIRKYNKDARCPIAAYDSSSKRVEEDFFDLMLAIDPVTHQRRIVTAYERAKAIHEAKKAHGAETSESGTTLYELLFELGVIEKTREGYGLYIK